MINCHFNHGGQAGLLEQNMTNNGIKTRDILQALHTEHMDWMDKHEFARITYRDFVRACHQIDIADPRTIKVKWEILQDKDILKSANKYNAIVDLYNFYDALGPAYLADYQASADRHTYTKTETHISTEAGE